MAVEQIETTTRKKKKSIFVFPNAAGHVNPSLPLCRELIENSSTDWRIEYLGVKTFQSAIESTGAIFHDRDKVCEEYGGITNLTELTYQSFDDYKSPGSKMWALNFGSIITARLLPIYIQFLKHHQPDVVVYCPVLCQVVHLAALHLGIPDVSLLTAAGPGYWDAAFASPAAKGATAFGLITTIRECVSNNTAIQSIRDQVGGDHSLTLNTDIHKPVVCDYYTTVNIVTTVEGLADKLNEKDAQYYKTTGQSFEYVGPMMMNDTTTTTTMIQQATVAPTLSDDKIDQLFQQVEDAMTIGRKIVYVSLGAVLTSAQDANLGWNGYAGSQITGKELCHAVYNAVFSVFGTFVDVEAEDGDDKSSNEDHNKETLSSLSSSSSFLIVVSTGSEPDALSNIVVPTNAICLPSVPQIRLLQKIQAYEYENENEDEDEDEDENTSSLSPSLAIVITHGGQNSFMEALAVGAPVVVCPGFGDQIANAIRAESHLRVGLKVDRPVLVQQKEPSTMSQQQNTTTSDDDDNDDDDDDTAATRKVKGNNKEETAEAVLHNNGIPTAAPVATYEQAVAEAIQKVVVTGSTSKEFAANAKAISKQLREAGGVAKAAQLVMQVAASAAKGTT